MTLAQHLRPIVCSALMLGSIALGVILTGSALSAQNLIVPGADENIQLVDASKSDDGAPPAISTADTTNSDRAIASRLQGIYREFRGLERAQARVQAGIVTLSGEVAEPGNVDRAKEIALRVDGVVAVQNNLVSSGDVSQNLAPVMERLSARVGQIVQILPMLAIALAIIVSFWFLGSALARAQSFWRRIAPNSFLAELIATTVRLMAIILGLVIALDLLGASTLLGAILGSAGVVGLAIGFAVKDTVDNYVSSLMLSVRQPFRAADHVVIGESEGVVIRLTSRATILMTLDGNHLRIPNSTVFRATILNYTRNPERRFTFMMGIDADDDPGEALKVGTRCLGELPFVLNDPPPGGRLEEVGDSNIVLRFLGWIDQTQTDWFKGRSAAIRAVKMELEKVGFGLPEPTYRLRFDSGSPLKIASSRQQAPDTDSRSESGPPSSRAQDDVSAENAIEEKVSEERKTSQEEDMLDHKRPIE